MSAKTFGVCVYNDVQTMTASVLSSGLLEKVRFAEGSVGGMITWASRKGGFDLLKDSFERWSFRLCR